MLDRRLVVLVSGMRALSGVCLGVRKEAVVLAPVVCSIQWYLYLHNRLSGKHTFCVIYISIEIRKVEI